MPCKSSIDSGHFKSWYFLNGISKMSKVFERMTILSKETLLLYELFEREPGWRFTARCHTGARATPVPNRPSLFITWACLNMFLFEKTIMILNSTLFKMNFVYRSFILAEYEHHVIMLLRFPSDFKFSRRGHFWEIFWFFLKISNLKERNYILTFF